MNLETVVGDTLDSLRSVLVNHCSVALRLIAQAREWADVTQRSARLVKREYPVQTLATIAAAAFLVGVGLRLWRSRV